MMRVLIMLVVVAVAQPVLAQVSNLQVVKATYETRSRASADDPVEVVEAGIHYIVADGRYRVDKQRKDIGTFEITDSSGAKFIGNTTTREVTPVRPFGPATRAELDRLMNDVDSQTVGGFNGHLVIGENMEYLGTREVGGLTLEGIKATAPDYPGLTADGPTMEMWLYFPAPPVWGEKPVNPVVMEERHSGGPTGAYQEKVLTDVTTEFVSPSIFTPPEGYVVVTEP